MTKKTYCCFLFNLPSSQWGRNTAHNYKMSQGPFTRQSKVSKLVLNSKKLLISCFHTTNFHAAQPCFRGFFFLMEETRGACEMQLHIHKRSQVKYESLPTPKKKLVKKLVRKKKFCLLQTVRQQVRQLLMSRSHTTT